MSRHHAAVGHTSIARVARPVIQASLPQPCIQPRCRRGGWVHPEDRWDVAHYTDLGLGGDPNQVGPAHLVCNRSDGGKQGARITNARKRGSESLW